MKNLIIWLLLLPLLASADAEGDITYGEAMAANPENFNANVFAQDMFDYVADLQETLDNICESRECRLITFRQHMKGWTAHLTVGNGPGSGASFQTGSQGSVNIWRR